MGEAKGGVRGSPGHGTYIRGGIVQFKWVWMTFVLAYAIGVCFNVYVKMFSFLS